MNTREKERSLERRFHSKISLCTKHQGYLSYFRWSWVSGRFWIRIKHFRRISNHPTRNMSRGSPLSGNSWENSIQLLLNKMFPNVFRLLWNFSRNALDLPNINSDECRPRDLMFVCEIEDPGFELRTRDWGCTLLRSIPILGMNTLPVLRGFQWRSNLD